jgi:thiamine-monophosphate kinase
MRETEIIESIRALAKKNYRDQTLRLGIGDDCAVLRPRAKEDLVFTSDFVLEDRHFTLSTHSPAAIGEKALARSLSDLAAMGAEPVFCLVSLAVPAKLNGLFVERFYRGFMRTANRYSISLAGGDLARFDKVIADVTCCGRVPRGKALLRNGAKPRERIFVTGKLGAAAHAFAAGRPILPVPRLEAGVALRKLGVSAAIDLSDGLSLDLARLCRESNVSADIFASSLPLNRHTTLDEALNGGEDYELLVTAAPKLKVPGAIGKLAIREIGVITRGRAGEVFLDGLPLQSKGFDHFA